MTSVWKRLQRVGKRAAKFPVCGLLPRAGGGSQNGEWEGSWGTPKLAGTPSGGLRTLTSVRWPKRCSTPARVLGTQTQKGPGSSQGSPESRGTVGSLWEWRSGSSGLRMSVGPYFPQHDQS